MQRLARGVNGTVLWQSLWTFLVPVAFHFVRLFATAMTVVGGLFLQKFHYTVMDWRPFRTIGKGMRLFTTTACTGFSSSSLSLSLPRQPKPSWIWPSLGWSTLNCRCGPTDNPCFQVFSGSILRTVVLPPSTAPASEHLWCPPHRSCHLPGGKAECMHASIACLLLHED